MKRVLFLAACFTMSAAIAHADEVCTEQRAEELLTEVIAYLQEHPSEEKKVNGYMTDIEREYDGGPSDEETCEALAKLLARIKEGS